jgi:hypothetical protein
VDFIGAKNRIDDADDETVVFWTRQHLELTVPPVLHGCDISFTSGR